MSPIRTTVGVLAALASLVFGASTAHAQLQIAVFGNNQTDEFINSLTGYSATLVSDAQLATPGFLSTFSAFYYTRTGAASTEAVSLSAQAAANVISFVGTVGTVVLLNADFADALPGASDFFPTGDPVVNQLTANAVGFAAASGRGFVGEYSGAIAALTNNANFLTPLNLIPGIAGPLGFEQGGSFGSIVATSAGAGHPVLAGVGLPYNPPDVEFGATLTGVPSNLVVATFDNGNPAVIVRAGVIPEPSTVTLFGTGLIGLVGYVRRRVGRRTT